MWWKLCCLILLAIATQNVKSEGMVEVFRWRQMDYYERGYQTDQFNNRRNSKLFNYITTHLPRIKF